MTQEDQLVEAFASIGLNLQPGLDTSAEGTYAVYAYDTDGSLFGDDRVVLEHRNWIIVFVAPLGTDQRSLRSEIRRTIETVCGVLPSEEDVTDGTSGQQYLYAFETMEV